MNKLRLPEVGLVASLLGLGACSLGPPLPSPPAVLGCYALAGNIPDDYADSLGYSVPSHLRLDSVVTPDEWGFEEGRWRVVPTDPEYHPYWTAQGDSVDVHFPGPLGKLVLRLGSNDTALTGRAAYGSRGAFGRLEWWSLDPPISVAATRTSCLGLPMALARSN